MSEVFEEFGLTPEEFTVLKVILLRSKFPAEKQAKEAHMKVRDFNRAAANLATMGMTHDTKTEGHLSWVITAKGRDTRRDILNALREVDGCSEEAPPLEEVSEEEGGLLGIIMEMANIIETGVQLCRLNHDWIRILSILRGNGAPMTAAEVFAFIDVPSGDAETLESKLMSKTDPEKIKREKEEHRWVERTSEEPPMFTITQAGIAALTVVVDDLKDRIKQGEQ